MTLPAVQQQNLDILDFIVGVIEDAQDFIEANVPLSRAPKDGDYDLCRLEFNADRMMQDVLSNALSAMYCDACAVESLLRSLRELREKNP